MSEEMTSPPRRRSNAWDRAIARDRAGLPPKWMVNLGETEFEHILKQAGGNVNSAQVREWVRQNHGRKWVPTEVLEACGIQAEELV
jgi:hypothetical protein